MRASSGSATRRALLWVLVCIIPFAPLVWPLALQLLSDTPSAYLLWVPVLSFIWMLRNLFDSGPSSSDDKELNWIIGTALAVIVTVAMVVGPMRLPLSFWSSGMALLFWPIWILGMTCLIFGVGTTRRVWTPAVYLLLSSPIIYSMWEGIVDRGLLFTAKFSLERAAAVLPWIVMHGDNGSVEFSGRWIPIGISSACTGADSTIALLIILPVLFSFYEKAFRRKTLVCLIGVVLAVFLNFVRVQFLIFLIHFAGDTSLFDNIHAALGIVLFTGLVLLLFYVSKKVGLKLRAWAPTPPSYAVLPTSLAVWAGVCLLPIAYIVFHASIQNANYTWRPLAFAQTMTDHSLPQMPGYQRITLGQYDDSSVLGAGAQSVAMAYSSSVADIYHRVEIWHGVSPWRMEAYGVQQCLTFHGEKVLSIQQVTLHAGMTGQVFTLEIPPLTLGGNIDVYEVVALTFAVRDDAGTAYDRLEISTPLQRGLKPSDPLVAQIAALVHNDWAGESLKNSGVPAFVLTRTRATQQFVSTLTDTLFE